MHLRLAYGTQRTQAAHAEAGPSPKGADRTSNLIDFYSSVQMGTQQAQAQAAHAEVVATAARTGRELRAEQQKSAALSAQLDSARAGAATAATAAADAAAAAAEEHARLEVCPVVPGAPLVLRALCSCKCALVQISPWRTAPSPRSKNRGTVTFCVTAQG